MPITIRELSRQCGLSVSTVSKALNGYPDISEATRQRVVDAARSLGYHPNAHARALKSGRSYNLGVLFSDENNSGLTHAYFSAVLEAFKREAEALGYDVTFISHQLSGSSVTYLEHCHYREVDGVCLACINFQDPDVQELAASDLPLVSIDNAFPGRVCIESDNAAGMRTLVEHVASKGHRNIAYIHGPASGVTSIRVESFREAVRALGLPLREDWILESLYIDPGSLRAPMLSLLESDPRPSCILCPDDFSSIGAFNLCAQMNLRIPEDIAIAGFDGIPVVQLMRPRLTTVRQDADRIGGEAARALVRQIESPGEARSSVIPCALIEGETV